MVSDESGQIHAYIWTYETGLHVWCLGSRCGGAELDVLSATTAAWFPSELGETDSVTQRT